MSGESSAKASYDRIQALLARQNSTPSPSELAEGAAGVSGNIYESQNATQRSNAMFASSSSFLGGDQGHEKEQLSEDFGISMEDGVDTSMEQSQQQQRDGGLNVETQFHQSLNAFLFRGPDEDLVGIRLEDKQIWNVVISEYTNSADQSFGDAERRLRTTRDAMEEAETNRMGSAKSRHAVKERKSAEVGESKAERDLWALLSIFARADLLIDLDGDACEKRARDAIQSLSPNAPAAHVHNVALQTDLRMKKGRVLCEWLETAARYDIMDVEPVDEPWQRTLNSHKLLSDGVALGTAVHMARNQVTSAHPDAQLSPDGLIFRLEERDNEQQDALLQAVWRFVRAGNITEAQQLSWRHHVFWLAASLSGAADPFYDSPDNRGIVNSGNEDDMNVDDEAQAVEAGGGRETIIRRGNLRRPVWLHSAWLYADKLASQSANWEQSNCSNGISSGICVLSGALYEMSIYAALGNNLPVLLKSPCLASWSDRLWAVVRAAHERDTMEAVRIHRAGKLRHSSLYPDCHHAIVRAEEELLTRGKEAGLANIGFANASSVSPSTSGNITALLQVTRPPTTSSGANTEASLLGLQAAVVQGYSGIDAFLRESLPPLLTLCSDYFEAALSRIVLAEDSTATTGTATATAETVPFPGAERFLRVVVHLLLWLRYSAPPSEDEDGEAVDMLTRGGSRFDLAKLPALTDALFYQAMECYVDYLVCTRQRGLVASYTCFLSQTRRVRAYARLLIMTQAQAQPSLSPSSSSAGSYNAFMEHPDAAEVMMMAKSNFCNDDVVQIATAVIEASKSREGKRALFGTTATASSSSSSHDSISPREQGEGVEGVEGDEQALQSLKWLCIDPVHRLEAVLQANRLIARLLLTAFGQDESSGRGVSNAHLLAIPTRMGKAHALVRKVLSPSCLPADTEHVGNSLLIALREQLSAEQPQDEEESLALEEEEQELLLKEAQWGVNMRQCGFWKAYLLAHDKAQHFAESLRSFQATRSDTNSSSSSFLAGNLNNASYRAKLETGAQDVINAVLHAITGRDTRTDSAEGELAASTGCMEIWHDAETLSVRSARQAVNLFMAGATVRLGTFKEGEAGYLKLDDCASLRSALSGLEKRSADLLDPATSLTHTAATKTPPDATGAAPRVVTRQREALHLTNGVLFDLVTAVEGCDDSAQKVPLRHDLKVAIEKVSLSLTDLAEARSVCTDAVCALLHLYTSVCLESGKAMEALDMPSFAHRWYARGVKMATLLADTDPALQLASTMPVTNIEKLLADVNACAVKTVDLKGRFDITI